MGYPLSLFHFESDMSTDINIISSQQFSPQAYNIVNIYQYTSICEKMNSSESAKKARVQEIKVIISKRERVRILLVISILSYEMFIALFCGFQVYSSSLLSLRLFR